MMGSQTLIPGEAQWLDNGVLGLLSLTLLVAIFVLFRLLTKERDRNLAETQASAERHAKELQIAAEKHKAETKELLYELVGSAKEQNAEYLLVADRVTKVIEALERRFRPGDHGDRGDRSDRGERGERGERGDRGERGERGDQRREGDP